MPNPDTLLQVLQITARSRNQGEYLRDQIMGHLRLQGVSLRTIAQYADLDHSTVAKRCKEIDGHLEDLETLIPIRRHLYPASEMITIRPEKMIVNIANQFSEYEPVQPEELERVMVDLDGLWENLPDELSPPGWSWILTAMQDLLLHVESDRASVRPEEVASQYRRGILAQEWRMEILGIDGLSEMRKRWMDILGRLTVEAHRREVREGG